MIFDSPLPCNARKPEASTASAPSVWSWELTMLLLAVTIVSILAGVLFPDALSCADTRFWSV